MADAAAELHAVSRLVPRAFVFVTQREIGHRKHQEPERHRLAVLTKDRPSCIGNSDRDRAAQEQKKHRRA